MDPGLQILVCKDKVNKIKELMPWIKSVRELDDNQHSSNKCFNEHLPVDEWICARKRLYIPSSSQYSSSNAPSSSSNTTNPYPPPLSDEE